MSYRRHVDDKSQRVAILAPTAQDAKICKQVLDDVRIEATLCANIEQLCFAIDSGAGAGLIAEEHLGESQLQKVRDALAHQPEWSDFPFLVLLTGHELSSSRVDQLLSLGHVTLISRPLRIAVFVSTLRARLRDRQRQFAVRDLLKERHQAVESAAIDARRLRMALQAGQMGVWELNHDELYWSPKFYELFGLDGSLPPDAEQCFEKIHSADRQAVRDHWNRSLERGENFRMEYRIDHPELGLRWLAAAGETLRGDAENTLRHAGLVWDVTQRHQFEDALQDAREQAESANRAKSEFLANMSHEIRTPMTAILGYIDLIDEKVRDDEARDHIDTVRRNGNFLLEIINDILDLSKIEAGKFELAVQSFSPNRLIDDVHRIMSVRAAEHHIELHVRYDGLVPETISNDPKRLKQILINLVGNAIKFTDRGSVTLAVSFDQTVNKIRFQVEDTGIGMTTRQLRRLFQPFTQADASVSRTFGGTGLGLAISQRLASIMGGAITVRSQAGEGSCFTVVIDPGDTSETKLVPLGRVDAQVPPSEPENSSPLTCRVLIVDDRRDIRYLASRLLANAGATIFEAEDGQEAVETMQDMLRNEQAVDLILLDMQMPRLDGYRTAEQLRRLGFKGPIIALTADAMQGDMDRCLACGCNDYLSKPVDSGLLLNKVRRFVHLKTPS